MTGKIFINYRRGDDPGHTGRLFDRLQDTFESDQLFLDVDNIAPGVDFVQVLNERVAESDVVLAVIGKNWIDARDSSGARRLDDPDDFVRIELTSALDQGKRVIPVLVGGAQMPRTEDLPKKLQALARRNAVRLTHERFRSDVQGLIKSLQQSLTEIEAQRDAEAEAKRRLQAEADRKQQEAETTRRAAEEERRRLAEAQAAERAAAERQRQEAEARQRVEAQRAIAAAKRAGTVLALDGFLATHGTSAFAEEAQSLKAALLAREAAYRDVAASDDAAALRSFIASYAKGADVDQVRRRLRRLESPPGRQRSTGLVIPGALALVLIGGAAVYWLAIKSPLPADQRAPAVANIPPAPRQQTVATPRPDLAAWNLLKQTTDAAALKHFVAEYPESPLRNEAEAKLAALEAAQQPKPAPPGPDIVAWQSLKKTTDEAALKRFTAQYPDSPLRKDAEALIATLEAARAIKPPPPRPDEVAWSLLKDTTDENALKRFVAQYADSPLRKDAEARIAALDKAQAAKPPPPRPDEVAWSLLKDTADENELKRFVAQYPDSPLRNDAETRIAALDKAQAAKPAPPSPEEIVWNLVKDSSNADEFRRFVEQFPAGKMRAQAEQRIAALTAATAKTTAADIPDAHALALSLQTELKRVGCFNGAVNGEFDDATRAAEHTFIKLTSIKLPDAISADAIDAVRKFDKRVCPLVCPEGERAEGDRCIAIVPQNRKVERTREEPRKKASRERPREQAPPQRAAAVEPSAPMMPPGQHGRLGPRYVVGKDGTLCSTGRRARNRCQ